MEKKFVEIDKSAFSPVLTVCQKLNTVGHQNQDVCLVQLAEGRGHYLEEVSLPLCDITNACRKTSHKGEF